MSNIGPQPSAWNKEVGFEHPNSKIDDDSAMSTRMGILGPRYSKEVTQDVGALEVNYERSMAGELGENERLVPYWAAQRGQDPKHRGRVEKMLNDMLNHPGVPGAVELKDEMLATYEEAVKAANEGQQW